MLDPWHRRFNSQIAAVAVQAGVISEAIGMAAHAELIVGLIEISRADHQFGLSISLKARPRHRIEYSISAIAKFRPVSAAAYFQVVNVFGIELRSDVRRDIRIRYWNAIHQPARLVPATNVQLVVDYVSPRNIIGDHRQTIRSAGSGSARYFEPVNYGGRLCRVRCDSLRSTRYIDS